MKYWVTNIKDNVPIDLTSQPPGPCWQQEQLCWVKAVVGVMYVASTAWPASCGPLSQMGITGPFAVQS